MLAMTRVHFSDALPSVTCLELLIQFIMRLLDPKLADSAALFLGDILRPLIGSEALTSDIAHRLFELMVNKVFG